MHLKHMVAASGCAASHKAVSDNPHVIGKQRKGRNDLEMVISEVYQSEDESCGRSLPREDAYYLA